MKFCCVSDIHSYLPEIPDCDVLLIGGDICPDIKQAQHWWLRDIFSPWLDTLAERNICVIGVAGNHDFVFQDHPDLVPKMMWKYLQDSGCEYKGFKIWGSPWQPRFYDWAFNLDEPDLAKKWELIPDDTEILLLHGPPHLYGDYSNYGNEHCGSPSLLRRIEELPNLKLAVAGHVHPGYGKYQIGKTTFVNASYVNSRYVPANKPIIIEL